MPAKQPRVAKQQNRGVVVTVKQESVSNAYAWGDNRHGQLGVDSRAQFINIPTLFTQSLCVAKVECGADHSVCLTKEGRVYNWGQYYLNSKKGEKLRTGVSTTPRLVESLVEQVIVDIACGTGHNLALSESKKMYSWGTGCQGELGIGADNLGNFKDA